MRDRLRGLTVQQLKWIDDFESTVNDVVSEDNLEELRLGEMTWDQFMAIEIASIRDWYDDVVGMCKKLWQKIETES